MRKHKFIPYLIFIKLFFLCISIIFLARGAFNSPMNTHVYGSTKIFTVDRADPHLQQTIQSIDAYLDATT